MQIVENFGFCLQGSVATPTQLRCDASDGIFSNHSSTSFPQNLLIKNLKIREYLPKNAEDMDKNLRLTFLAHPVVYLSRTKGLRLPC